MGGWVDGHFDIFFDILLKPPQPFTGLFFFDPFPTYGRSSNFRHWMGGGSMSRLLHEGSMIGVQCHW